MKNIKSIDTLIFLFFLINTNYYIINSYLPKLNIIELTISFILTYLIGLSFINYIKFLLNKNIKLTKLFKIISAIISFIIVVISLNITINFIYLNIININKIYIIISILLLIIFINKNNIDTIIKTSGLYIYIFIIIYIITLIYNINNINIYYISFYYNINIINIFKAINLYLIILISPCFYLFYIKNIKYSNNFIIFYKFTLIYIFINTFLNKNINNNFINMNILFSLFIFISINYKISINIFKIKKENIFHLIYFLILLLSFFIFSFFRNGFII